MLTAKIVSNPAEVNEAKPEDVSKILIPVTHHLSNRQVLNAAHTLLTLTCFILINVHYATDMTIQLLYTSIVLTSNHLLIN